MLRLMGTLCIVMSVAAASGASAEQRTLTLEEATRLALTDNPGLRTLAASTDAAQARRAGASLLFQSNPSVTATAGPRSSDVGRSSDYSVLVLQQFEIAGQRGARIEAAEAALEAMEAQVQALRADVAARVRENFGRALAAEQRVQLSAEAVAVAHQGVNAAEERFRAGAAPLLEVNTVRVELGRAARARGDAERLRAEAFADLHLLLGLDPLETVTLQGEQVSDEPVPGPAELVQEALANRGEVKASRRALDAAKAEARLASREWIPSPRIGVSSSHEQESNTTILQGVLSFDLPLFNRNKAARGVAASRVAQSEMALEATDRRIRQEVLTALARIQAARSAADGYASDVVRAMQENMELVTESYRAGKIDFLQLLVIRRQTLEARREYIDVLEELNAARAQLNRALGRIR